MFCYKCGQSNPENSQVCSSCGSPLKTFPADNVNPVQFSPAKNKSKKILIIALIAIFILAGFGAIGFFAFSKFTTPSKTELAPGVMVEKKGNITNYTTEGNLESTQDIGCLSLSELKNTYTPADIFNGLEVCIEKKEYERAVEMYLLAMGYGYFDGERVKDPTAAQAILVLSQNYIGANLSGEELGKFKGLLEEMINKADERNQFCQKIKKIGPPNYYPSYMIQHGMGAFSSDSNSDGALKEDFDSEKVWNAVLSNAYQCDEEGDTIKGGLESTYDIGCTGFSGLKNIYTPADILKGLEACLNQGEYEKAVEMYSVAMDYASFDARRVNAENAYQAFRELSFNHLQTNSNYNKFFLAMGKTDLIYNCQEEDRIGPPNYYPKYMIEYAMDASSPDFDSNKALKDDFDSKKTWDDIMSTCRSILRNKNNK